MAAATERPEGAPAAAPAAAAAPAPAAKKSSMGMVIVAVLLVVVGVGVFLIVKSGGSKSEGTGSMIQQKYAQVNLEQISRELPVGEGAVKVNESFMIEPVLVINPNFENLDEIAKGVDLRKDLLRDRVIGILYQKTPYYFSQQGVREDLASEIKKQLNQLLGRTKDGQEVIDRVLFTQFRSPVN